MKVETVLELYQMVTAPVLVGPSWDSMFVCRSVSWIRYLLLDCYSQAAKKSYSRLPHATKHAGMPFVLLVSRRFGCHGDILSEARGFSCPACTLTPPYVNLKNEIHHIMDNLGPAESQDGPKALETPLHPFSAKKPRTMLGTGVAEFLSKVKSQEGQFGRSIMTCVHPPGHRLLTHP